MGWPQDQNPPPSTCINWHSIDLIWHPSITSYSTNTRSYVHTWKEKKKKNLFCVDQLCVFCLTSVDFGSFVFIWPSSWLILEAEFLCDLTLIDWSLSLFLGRWPRVDCRSISVIWQNFDCGIAGWILALWPAALGWNSDPLLQTLTWTSVDYFSLISLVWLGIYWGLILWILIWILWCTFFMNWTLS